MKRKFENEMEDELRSEYDFSKLQGEVRGKYVDRYRSGTNLVLLDPDVARAFPNDAAVNEALRLLLKIAQRQQPKNPPAVELGRSTVYVTGDREGEE